MSMKTKQKFSFGLLTVILVVSGCSFGPKHVTPEVETPSDYRFSEEIQPDSIVNLAWWELFKDQKLNHLMERVFENNLDLVQAYARLEQAQVSLTSARSGYFPRLSARAEASRSRMAMKFGEMKSSFDRDTLNISLAASYEIDLWGKVRNSVKAARYELQATNLRVLRNFTQTACLFLSAQSRWFGVLW